MNIAKRKSLYIANIILLTPSNHTTIKKSGGDIEIVLIYYRKRKSVDAKKKVARTIY